VWITLTELLQHCDYYCIMSGGTEPTAHRLVRQRWRDW
jgi:hypothetical protein